jgi:hypothetical protein
VGASSAAKISTRLTDDRGAPAWSVGYWRHVLALPSSREMARTLPSCWLFVKHPRFAMLAGIHPIDYSGHIAKYEGVI